MKKKKIGVKLVGADLVSAPRKAYCIRHFSLERIYLACWLVG